MRRSAPDHMMVMRAGGMLRLREENDLRVRLGVLKWRSSVRKPTPHRFEVVLLDIVLSFISVLTVVLNLLVIISVSHFRQLHTPTNILLLSLAVSDFLVGFVSLPGQIYRRAQCWFLGDLLCSLYYYVSYLVFSTSVGNMVLISADRYVAIIHPLHYTTRITVTKVKFCVFLCWFCSIFYSSVVFKDALIQPGIHNSCYGECTVVLSYIADVVDLVLNFIAPVTAIVLLYMRVFVVAVSQAHAMRSHTAAVTHQHSVTVGRMKSELKAARTLGVLVVVFLMFYCPFYCVALAWTSLSVVNFVFVMFYLNSCLNPVIYALFYPWFRKASKHIITLQILQPGSCEFSMSS
ncbi:trace amine-associated receptor 8a-like [Stegastes partitus]|uniref:Trace amine-associated receptor 8a-like n=1 Tax=Stegastes partitus TaxID=144197 RepID=A0A9Y4TWE8_9TELE|nr:PREDICTED: trace amine-associated receptor 8a-like [Stegastes partitus]